MRGIAEERQSDARKKKERRTGKQKEKGDIIILTRNGFIHERIIQILRRPFFIPQIENTCVLNVQYTEDREKTTSTSHK